MNIFARAYHKLFNSKRYCDKCKKVFPTSKGRNYHMTVVHAQHDK